MQFFLLVLAARLAAQTVAPERAPALPLPDVAVPAESPSLSVLTPLAGDLPALPAAPEALTALAAAPAPPAKLRGRALLEELTRRTGEGYTPIPYWRARLLLFTVVDPVVRKGVAGIVDAYSGRFIPGRWSDGVMFDEDGRAVGELNPEHLWPQQYYDAEIRGDLHNLLAVDPEANTARSSQPFGEPSPMFTYFNGGGARTNGVVFEPPDVSKGRVARALLYFYARHHEDGIFHRRGDSKFWNPQVATLLDWNRRFPPSPQERERNDRVERLQGNRNPFIDDPSLADRIGENAFLEPPSARRTARP